MPSCSIARRDHELYAWCDTIEFDTLTVTGKITEKKVEDGENRVYLETNVVNQNGDATCPGHAIVVLPNRE